MLKYNFKGALDLRLGRDGVTITITDKVSGLIACEVEMSLIDYALAMAAHGNQPCTFFLNRNGQVGMAREVKHIKIPWKGMFPKGRELSQLRAKVATYCTDGWEMGNEDDFQNGHNYKDDHFETHLVRWVPVKEG